MKLINEIECALVEGKKETIGKFKVEFIDKSESPFNAAVEIRVNGKNYQAIRQGGGLNFWAFPLRTKMSNEEGKQLDKFINSQM